MKLLFAYLRERRRTVLSCLLFALVLAASFALYHLPLEAVIYPAALCLLFGLLFLLLDFLRVRKKHRTMCDVQRLTAAMIHDLPETDGIEESDYRALVNKLIEEVAQIRADEGEKFRDMVDYYTIWVHQIKTPIAAMKLTLQSEDTPLSRRLSADLFRIEQYVEMVLAFLRLDSDSSDYLFRYHALDPIVRASVKKFAPEFIGRKIKLDYTPIHQRVVTDDKWLAFALEQVLSNALKYTREGSISIYLRQPMTLCVRDTGIGIAPEDLPRIFEKGYTGYNGRGDKSASGIGLYLCRRVCKNLGAEISVESEPGRGTTVCIDLSQRELRVE